MRTPSGKMAKKILNNIPKVLNITKRKAIKIRIMVFMTVWVEKIEKVFLLDTFFHWVSHRRKRLRGIIEHVHNQMAVFAIGHCSNLTRAALANQKACGSFLINRPALPLWFLCVLISPGWASQISAMPKSKDSHLIMDMLDNTSSREMNSTLKILTPSS